MGTLLRPSALFAVSVLLGALLATIHPPFNLWFLGVWAFPIAFWLVRYFGHERIFGYGFGFGYFFVTLHWIYEPFQIEKEVFGFMGYPAWVSMAAGLALFWLFIFRFQRMGAWWVAITFIAFELLRGYLFTGFPWALLAYGFVDTPFAEAARFIGAYGVSFALVLALLSLFGPGSILQRASGFVVFILLLVPSILGQEPEDVGYADFEVQLVQANITQKEALEHWRTEEFIDRQLELSQGGADLVIWPEGAIAYDISKENELAKVIMERLDGPALLLGTPYLDDDKFYNSATLVSADGKMPYRYDKRHLVPFGEYIPFGEALRSYGLMPATLTRFSMNRGQKRDWELNDLPPIDILICYEGIFPYETEGEGAFIALLTNDSWFGHKGGPYQHLAAARFRAIESGKPVVRAAKTGVSALINAKGEIVDQVPLDEAGSLTAKVGPRFANTIYHKLWDRPLLALILISLLKLFISKPRLAKRE